MNLEIGCLLSNDGPGIAARRSDEHCICVLQVIETKISRKAEEYVRGTVLGKARQCSKQLQVPKPRELLRAQVCLTVSVDSREWEIEVSTSDVVGEGHWVLG